MNRVFPRINKIMRLLQVSKIQAEIVKAILNEDLNTLIFKGTGQSITGKGARVNNQMEAANTVIGGFGVEAIRQLNIATDPYWMDTRAIYVNVGDTYTQTLVYDVLTDRFYFMSWGDFVEKAERKGAKFP